MSSVLDAPFFCTLFRRTIEGSFRSKYDKKVSYLLIIVNYNGLEDKYLYKKFVSTTLFCNFAMKRDLKKRKLKEFYFNTENTEDSEKKNESLYLSKEIFVYSVFSVFQKS